MHLKQRLVDGTVEDGVQSRATTGKPSRALRSRWSEVWEEPGAPEPLPMPLQTLLVPPLLTAISRIAHGGVDTHPGPARCSTAGVRAIKPAARVVYDLGEERRNSWRASAPRRSSARAQARTPVRL